MIQRLFLLGASLCMTLVASAAGPPASFDSPIGFPTGNPGMIAAGDLNSDGKADLAVAHTGQQVSILLGNGHGGFRRAASTNVPYAPRALAVGDLNGDGRLDVA